MHAFEMMEKVRANDTGSKPREEIERMMMGPLGAALNSAVVGADKYKSAL